MKTNNLLTYLLYALLLGLIVAAGWKACQMKKEKQILAEKQEAELQQTLHDMGYKTDDSTAANGSTYAGNDATTEASSKSTAAQNGIEDEPSAAQTTAATKTKTATPPATTTAVPSKTTAKSTDNGTAKPTAKSLTAATTKSSAVRDLDTDTRGGRYQVRAGTFTKMEGARRQLEDVIQLGYTNAEIGKTNKGKYAVVVAMRTDNKNEAIAVADKLEARGLDAAVVDSRRKN